MLQTMIIKHDSNLIIFITSSKIAVHYIQHTHPLSHSEGDFPGCIKYGGEESHC